MTNFGNRFLDLSFLRAAPLRDTPSGALFMPATKDGDRFLAGRLNVFPVLVILEGGQPFRVADRKEWSRSPGMIVERIKFQGNPSMATRIQHASEAANGDLLLTDFGPAIASYDHNGTKAVLLSDGDTPTDIEGRTSIAFASWRIVTDELSPILLFER